MKDRISEANFLWDQLGNTPVNDNGEIEEKFLDFEVGTDTIEIWHWFEETYNLSVAVDLMKLTNHN